MSEDTEYAFTITVVGKGKTAEEAWEDAKESALRKVDEDNYDKAEELK